MAWVHLRLANASWTPEGTWHEDSAYAKFLRGSKSLVVDIKFAIKYFDLRFSTSGEYLLGGLRLLHLIGKV